MSNVETGKLNLDSKTVLLNSGYTMPVYGLGTYSLKGSKGYDSILYFLKSGGRLIDTAHMYKNEEETGKAVRDSGIKRSEIFVITKLYPNQFSKPEEAIEQALEKLNIEYIDMMLLHHPGKDDLKAYHAVEKYIETGKIKSAGLSNWYIDELKNFLGGVNIMPALVQNEIHPYYQENNVIPYIQNHGIVVQSWYPLGGRGYTKELLNNKIITEIAKKYNVSSAQVILRWNLQRNIVVIPGSCNYEHIKENMDLFSFQLTDEDMEKIKSLDRNEKHDWY